MAFGLCETAVGSDRDSIEEPLLYRKHVFFSPSRPGGGSNSLVPCLLASLAVLVWDGVANWRSVALLRVSRRQVLRSEPPVALVVPSTFKHGKLGSQGPGPEAKQERRKKKRTDPVLDGQALFSRC